MDKNDTQMLELSHMQIFISRYTFSKRLENNLYSPKLFVCLFVNSHLRIYLFIFLRERIEGKKGRGERMRERVHQCERSTPIGCRLHMCPDWGRDEHATKICNLDWELKLRPFSV